MYSGCPTLKQLTDVGTLASLRVVNLDGSHRTCQVAPAHGTVTDNNRLIQILNNIREQMYRYRLEYIKDRESWNTLVDEHMAIYESLKKRDSEAAVRAILIHIDNQEKKICEKMGFDL